MATTSSTRVVEGTLTNGQRRKLNALRKSVGNEIGEQAFTAWLSSQSASAAAEADQNAAMIADGFQARRLIGDWVRFYNLERPHLALDGRTPAEAYRADPPVDMMDKPLRALPTSPQAQQQQKEDRSKEILAA